MADATEVGFMIAELVSDHQAFPDAAAHDLHRLLGHRIAAPNTKILRYDRLQLLLNMLLDNGVVPTVDEYQAHRAATASGDAPAASTLIVAYGHWLAACNAAYRLLGRRTAAAVSHTSRHRQFRRSFTPREILDAIDRFHDRFGAWPHQWEFLEWGRIERAAALRAGAPDPRIPTAPTLARVFGTYPRAVAAAQAQPHAHS
jgi:hypothetical protein